MVEYFFPLTCTSLEISSVYLLLFETFDAMTKHKLFAGRKIFRAENLADFGFAFPTGPIFFMQPHELDRGFHRFFSRWKFQDPEASDNLLGFGERPIDRFDFSAGKPHARPSCSRFQCSTATKCAGFSGFFVELIHRVEEFLGWLHRVFGVLDQHHESHFHFSFLFSAESEMICCGFDRFKIRSTSTSNGHAENRQAKEDYFCDSSCLPSSLWRSIASLGAKSSSSKNLRTSISQSWPGWGEGARLAHSMASSRDFTWMIQ